MSMGKLKGDDVKRWMREKGLVGVYDRVVCLRPTGWTYKVPKSKRSDGDMEGFGMRDLNPSYTILELHHNRDQKRVEMVSIPVPYSEHSSFDELREFVVGFKGRVGRVVGTVGGGREGVRVWCEKWRKGIVD